MAESKCSSQWKQKKNMKSINNVKQEFFKANSADKNVCVDQTSGSVQEISIDCAPKILDLYNFSSDKILKPEEHCPAYQCDKLNSVFVDIGSDLVESDYLFEEGYDVSKGSSITLFADDKDIDYNLVNSVKMERDLEGRGKENEINGKKLGAIAFNNSYICTNSNDRLGLSTNGNVENVYENWEIYDKKPKIRIDYSKTSKIIGAYGVFEKINTNLKVEEGIEGELVHQNTERTEVIHHKIKEEMISDDEVSIINECIIDIELCPVTKIEKLSNTGENNMPVLNGSYSDKLPDNSNEEIEMKNVFIVQNPLKATEAVQRQKETNLQNNVQAQNLTFQSDLQIELETNSRDYNATSRGEGCIKFCMADDRMKVKSINNEICENQRNRVFKYTINRPYVCEVCSKGFTYLSKLKTHRLIHTGDRPYGCDICGKAYTRLAHLTNHKLIHTGDRPYCCDVCGKVFRELSHLTRHKRIHTGDKPFGCSICGKTFTQLCHLTTHERIHTGGPFDCNICGKAFTRPLRLTLHKRMHTGDRPFGCSVCGKTFTQLSYLKKHKFIHTGAKPFGCSICKRTFTQMATLTKHKQKHSN